MEDLGNKISQIWISCDVLQILYPRLHDEINILWRLIWYSQGEAI